MKKIYLFKMFLMAFVLMLLGGVNASAEEVSLSQTKIYNEGTGASTSYGEKTLTDEKGNTWKAYAIRNSHSNETNTQYYLQIKKYKKNTASYIQVPALGSKITKIEMTVSNVSSPMTGGGNSATLFFSNDNKTSSTGTGVASGTGDKSVTIDASSLNLNSGYITADGSVRIWDVKVTYETSSTPTTNFKYSAIEYNAVLGGTNTFPTLTNDYGTEVTYNSSNTSVATIDEKNGNITLVGVGTTTITATLNANNSVKASYTLNVSQTHTWDLSKIDYISQSENEVVWSSSIAKMVLSKESSQTKANNYLGGNTTNTETRVYQDQKLTITPIDGIKITKVIITSTEKTYQGYFALDEKWTNATTSKGSNYEVIVTPKDGTQSIIFTVKSATRATKVIVYYTGEPTVENKTLVAMDEERAYYSTFSSDRDVVFTNDVIVNAVTIEDGILKLKALDTRDYNTINSTTAIVTNGYYVPANTGVLIYATDENITYYTAATGQDHASLPNNQLVAATTNGKFEGVTGYKYYKLAYDDYENKTGLGFYYGAAGGAAFVVKKGLAYLAVPVNGSNPAAGYAFGGNGGDDTTGINGIENDNVNETQTIYNLQGQRVEKAGLRGIYIVNGKKVVLK